MGRPKKPTVHGECYTYRNGCRCDPCKNANNKYNREWVKTHPRKPTVYDPGSNSVCFCGKALTNGQKWKGQKYCSHKCYAHSRIKELAHGYGGYQKGCRCEVCREGRKKARIPSYCTDPEAWKFRQRKTHTQKQREYRKNNPEKILASHCKWKNGKGKDYSRLKYYANRNQILAHNKVWRDANSAYLGYKNKQRNEKKKQLRLLTAAIEELTVKSTGNKTGNQNNLKKTEKKAKAK